MKFLKLLVLLGNIKGDNLKRFELRIQKLFNTTHPENDAAFFQVNQGASYYVYITDWFRYLHLKYIAFFIYPNALYKEKSSQAKLKLWVTFQPTNNL